MAKEAAINTVTNPEHEKQGRASKEAHNRSDKGGGGHDVKDNPHGHPGEAGSSPEGPMEGPLMTFTQMLESLAAVSSGFIYASGNEEDDDMMSAPIQDEPPTPPMSDEPGLPMDDEGIQSDPAPAAPMGMGGTGINEDELLNQLNQIVTPILVMQGFEGEISDQVMEACSSDNILLERNIIKFDDATRMAQLQMICALLISRQKNTQLYQMFKKACEICQQSKLEIQKQEFAAAQALAQKFLVKVSTTNNSSVARNSAQNLLPSTQH